MKTKIIILLLCFFSLNACGQSANNDLSAISQADTESKPMGTWQRQELYVDGALQPADIATLNLNEDSSYSSETPLCASSGDYKLKEDQLTLNMTTTNCPGVPTPLTVSYKYLIEKTDEKELMTLTTANITAHYSR